MSRFSLISSTLCSLPFSSLSPGSNSFRSHSFLALLAAVTLAGCGAPDGGNGGGDTDDRGSTGGNDSGIKVDIKDPGGGPVEGEYCSEVDLNFVPRTPTVYMLVDQSGSMWDYNFWEPAKAGLLDVVQQLQADVRFGFGTIVGTSAMCQGLDDSGILQLDAHQAISSFYNSLTPPNKGETPTSIAIGQAVDLLNADKIAQADAGEPVGDQYIILVTDGQPDFCDDASLVCAQDASIAEIQAAKAAGINTLVFGLSSEGLNLTPFLDRMANAGAGHPVAHLTNGNQNDEQVITKPQSEGQPSQLYYQCQGKADWTAAKDNDGQLSAASYEDQNGAATAISSDDTASLVSSIRAAVEGLKSCEMDLSKSNVSIDPAYWSQGVVAVDGVQIAADQWEMLSDTLLLLKGEACNTWQLPEVTEFFAGFPCEGIVVR